MTVLIIFTVLSFAGIGVVVWLLKNEQQETDTDTLTDSLSVKEETKDISSQKPSKPPKKEKQKSSLLKKLLSRKTKSVESLDTDASQPIQAQSVSKPKISLSALTDIFKKFNLSGILEKLPFGKGRSKADEADTVPLPSLKEYFDKAEERPANEEPTTGTASLKTVPANTNTDELSPKVEENKPDNESQLNELQEKYDKLDALFKEKSAELQTTKESLANEIENRKEFHKVKDILEKEIKDHKDKVRSLNQESENAKSEIEGYEKRASELNEKVTSLEKTLHEKDNEINDLLKRLQTFASPPTAATPQVMEGTNEKHETASDQTPESTKEPEESATPDGDQIEEPSSEDTPTETVTEQAPEPIASSESLEAEPPEPYEEPSQDDELQEEEKEENFLKLQPDIVLDEPKQEDPKEEVSKEEDPKEDEPKEDEPKQGDSIASEIEQSLGAPPELEIQSDPGQKKTPDIDLSHPETDDPTTTEQKSESPPNDEGQNSTNNDNVKE